MADKDTTERRVYNLPPDLLERLRAYQVDAGLTSEAEAARRLLDSALQMRDSVKDILRTLQSKYLEEKDLRILASEVLTRHFLVRSVEISDADVVFILTNGERGRIASSGRLEYGHQEQSDDYWCAFESPRPKRVSVTPSWEPNRTNSDLDDDIPF